MVVQKTLMLETAPEAIWPYLVDGAKVARWLADDASIDASLGGDVSFKVDRSARAREGGKVVRVTAPTQLAFTWDMRVRGRETRSVVAIELVPTAQGTRMSVVHTCLEGGDDPALRLVAQRTADDRWERGLARLQRVLRRDARGA